MFKCNECGCTFAQPKQMSAEAYYGVSNLFSHSCGQLVCVCPNCKETDFEEVDEEEDD